MPKTGEPTEGQEPEATTTEATETTETTETSAVTDKWANLPEEFSWVKDALEGANREAAGRRVALREAEDKLKNAKTPEEVEALKAELTSKHEALEAELARERAARKHGLSDDLAEFLTATTEADIEAQASKLAALKGTNRQLPTPPPNGGADPSQKPTELSGREAWRKFKESRR